MSYTRIQVERLPGASLVRFLEPPEGARYDSAELRNELACHVASNSGRLLIVDFGDYQSYPAEILGSLAHARKILGGEQAIRCVNLPLRLRAASRFLRFFGSILESYESLTAALPTPTPVVAPSLPAAALVETGSLRSRGTFAPDAATISAAEAPSFFPQPSLFA